jgi:CHRD domain
MRLRLLTALGAAALVGALAIPGLVMAIDDPTNRLRANMTGEQIVPTGQGADAGVGRARVTLFPNKKQVCFRIVYRKIGGKQGLNAGIYEGAKGQNGNLAVALFSGPKPSPVKDCAKGVSTQELKDIKRHPRQHHLNVKNKKYPQYGAIRGQLKPRD